MGVFNFYVYQRNGKCLFYREWNRPNNPLSDNLVEDQRLVFGLIFSLQNLCLQLSPTPDAANQEGFQSYRTARYALNFFEAPSGVIFAINTDLSTPLTRKHMWHIYSNIYVPFVVRNPLCEAGEVITAAKFVAALDEYIRAA
jgi:trafficking protein particle complex subunit 1